MAKRSTLTRLRRIILRFSFNNDSDSVIRNTIASKLESAGITNQEKTGTWESDEISLIKAMRCLGEVTNILAHPAGVEGADKKFRVDNFWMYVD